MPKSPIIDALENIREKHIRDSFRDFLSLAMSALSKDEDTYQEVLERYRTSDKKADTAEDHFAKALDAFFEETARDSSIDHLGRAYESSGLSNANTGQFFTPESLSDLCTELTLPDFDGSKPMSVSDPCCGSGRMLISTMRRLHVDSCFYAIDVDRMCVDMCALNLLVRNANAYIVHGNTLSLEAYGGYILKRSVFGGYVRRISTEIAQQVIEYGLSAQEQAA